MSRGHRPRYWDLDGRRCRVYWNGRYWIAVWDDTEEYITSVSPEGSQYIASGYPGKKWGSIKQAIEYTLTMRHG